MPTASQLIKKLKLELNGTEGRYFASTYPLANAKNPPCSAIYYLLDNKRCSILHSVTSDMLYHFYSGDPVEMLLLYPKGHVPESELCIFSNDLQAGRTPMKVIPAGTWLGSRIKADGTYALMGVSMAPAFDPNGYKFGERDTLMKQYPNRKKLIIALTEEPKK